MKTGLKVNFWHNFSEVFVVDCIFCKIINKEIPSTIVWESDSVLAFKDVAPAAPVHVLVIPKKHITDITSITGEDKEIVWEIHEAIKKIASQLELGDGFRVVVNCGADGGQTVGHLHYHILGGRKLQWPPG
ncbi:MAG: histidine triad nucleotide-binding protein [Firmicutes bacterium]|nr:histidine triad nucleotide-binding protein [Bacillota bacterium]